MAVFDQQLRSRFEWLGKPSEDALASPPLLMLFDLLQRAGMILADDATRAVGAT